MVDLASAIYHLAAVVERVGVIISAMLFVDIFVKGAFRNSELRQIRKAIEELKEKDKK